MQVNIKTLVLSLLVALMIMAWINVSEEQESASNEIIEPPGTITQIPPPGYGPLPSINDPFPNPWLESTLINNTTNSIEQQKRDTENYTLSLLKDNVSIARILGYNYTNQST